MVDDDGESVKTVRASYASFVWGSPEERDTVYPSIGVSRWVPGQDPGQIIQVSKKSVAERAGLRWAMCCSAWWRADQVGQLVAQADGELPLGRCGEGSHPPRREGNRYRHQLPAGAAGLGAGARGRQACKPDHKFRRFNRKWCLPGGSAHGASPPTGRRCRSSVDQCRARSAELSGDYVRTATPEPVSRQRVTPGARNTGSRRSANRCPASRHDTRDAHRLARHLELPRGQNNAGRKSRRKA